MARRICVAIGVSVVRPGADGQSGFAVLDGAIPAAWSLGNWAKASGFAARDIAVITDDHNDNPVTAERVRKTVAAMFGDGAEPVNHMLLTFCGHGLTGVEVGSIFWLLSDALERQYRVNALSLVGELAKYGVPRITLISDACRDAPNSLNLERLDAHRVINGPNNAVESPGFDRLVACQDGKSAFMVGDTASALPGKCIFSGVVADLLWKRESIGGDNSTVDTSNLGKVARSRATERARQYALELYPQSLVDPDPAVLVGADQILPAEASAQPWPDPTQVRVMGAVALEPRDAKVTANTWEAINTDSDFRAKVLGAGFGTTVSDLDLNRNFSGFPMSAASVLSELVDLRSIAKDGKVDSDTRAAVSERADQAVKTLAAAAAAEARRRVAGQLRRNVKPTRIATVTTVSNFVSIGTEIVAIFARDDSANLRAANLPGKPQSWRISSDRSDLSIFAQTRDGHIIPVTLYHGLFATISKDPRGGYVVAHGAAHDSSTLRRTFESIADLAAGKLSPADRNRLAIDLRAGKHVDPVRGVIAAYLYKSVADIDSIRRMAYFYGEHQQAVPFDIALLGDIAVEILGNGELCANVPSVQSRSDASEDLPSWAVQATPAARVMVGGLMPWLSVGWDYVSDPTPNTHAMVERILPLRHQLERRGFTNLRAETVVQLREQLSLRMLPIQ